MRRQTLLVTALALSLGGSASAQSGGRCTRETLNVHGTPLTAAYCVTSVGAARAGRELPVSVTETYSTPKGAFSHGAVLQFIAGEEASRVIEDVALQRFGMAGMLHLTLLYRGGAVRIESAMLTPGAITIK